MRAGQRQRAFGTRQPAFGTRQWAFGTRQPAFGTCQWVFGTRPPAFGTRPPAFGARPSTPSTRRAPHISAAPKMSGSTSRSSRLRPTGSCSSFSSPKRHTSVRSFGTIRRGSRVS